MILEVELFLDHLPVFEALSKAVRTNRLTQSSNNSTNATSRALDLPLDSASTSALGHLERRFPKRLVRFRIPQAPNLPISTDMKL
jgi:hypothetical protein